MNRFIRWPGLLAFVLITGLIAGGTVLFAGKAVEKGIEIAGTQMVGAKVDVNKVSLSLSPLGFSIYRLQVTDPEQPMVNAFDVAEVDFHMDTMELLRLKTVITDMQIKGLQVNTPRKTSGAILRAEAKPEQAAETDAEEEKGGLPALNEVDVAAIFQREELASLEHINRLKVDLGQAREQWKSALAGMPNDEKINSYSQRISEVSFDRTGNTAEDLKQLEAARKTLKKLRAEIKGDMDHVSETRKELLLVNKTISSSAREAKTMAGQDVSRLREKYSLSPEGLGNISGLLFGEKVQLLLQDALVWYGKLMPIYRRFESSGVEEEDTRPERFAGRDIRFPEQRPMPDFLVRKAGVSMDLPVGKITGEIRNLTSDQSVLGHPLTFNLFSKEMHDVQDIEITGTFNHVDEANSRDNIRVVASHISLKELDVLKDDQFPLQMAAAKVNLEGDLELIGENLGAHVKTDFMETSFAIPFAEKPGAIAEGLAAAIKDVDAFNAEVVISGTIRKHGVSFTSSLDDVLKDAVGEQVRKAAAELEKNLRAELDQRLKGPRSELDKELAGLKKTADDLDKLRARLKKVDDEADQRRRELENKAKARTDTGKQKIKEKKDVLKDKLKDKIRF